MHDKPLDDRQELIAETDRENYTQVEFIFTDDS